MNSSQRFGFGLGLLAFFVLIGIDVALAQSTIIPLPGNFPGTSSGIVEGTGSQGVVLTLLNIYQQGKRLLAPVMVILIGSFGIRMITAGGNEENFSATTRQFLYVLIGIGIVFLSDFLAQTFLLYSLPEGSTEAVSFLSSNQQLAAAAGRITGQIRLVVLFLRYLLGGIALFYVVRAGAVILFSAEEETVDKEKDTFMYGFVGLILIMVSEALVNAVFNVQTLPSLTGPLGAVFATPSVNVSGGIGLITNVTNLLLAMLSGLFLFTLVVGGVMYAFSLGNEERGQQAQKMIIGSLLGLVIAFSSYTIVAEFSSGGQPVRTVEAPSGSEPIAPIVTPSP